MVNTSRQNDVSATKRSGMEYLVCHGEGLDVYWMG